MIIAGLGNNLPELFLARSNAGLSWIAEFAQYLGLTWTDGLALFSTRQNNLVLLRSKASLYESGIEISQAMKTFNISAEDVLIVHANDQLVPGDIHLDYGPEFQNAQLRGMRIDFGGAAFWKLGLGIGRRPSHASLNWPLLPLSAANERLVEFAIENSIPHIAKWVRERNNAELRDSLASIRWHPRS